MTFHVYPLDDLRRHETDGEDCWCEPSYQYEIGWLDHILIHNSADGREAFERGEREYS